MKMMLERNIAGISSVMSLVVFYLFVYYYFKRNERFAWNTIPNMLKDKYFVLLGLIWIVLSAIYLYYSILLLK